MSLTKIRLRQGKPRTISKVSINSKGIWIISLQEIILNTKPLLRKVVISTIPHNKHYSMLHFPNASPLAVLRAGEKDQCYLQEFEKLIRTFAADLVPSTLTDNFKGHLDTATRVLYYALSLSNCVITPGEEYFRLFPVEHKSQPLAGENSQEALPNANYLFPSWSSRLCYIFYIGLSSVLSKNKSFLLLHNVHSSLFLLWERYPTLAHRLSGLSYLALRKPAQGEQKPYLKAIGCLNALCFAVLHFWDEHLAAKNSLPQTHSSTATETLPHSCTLCLQEFCSQDSKVQTVVQCGHIFCWSCITHWIQHGKVNWSLFINLCGCFRRRVPVAESRSRSKCSSPFAK